MARLVKVGTNAKGGFNYQIVLDNKEDIKVLIKWYRDLDEAGMISHNFFEKNNVILKIKSKGCEKL